MNYSPKFYEREELTTVSIVLFIPASLLSKNIEDNYEFMNSVYYLDIEFLEDENEKKFFFDIIDNKLKEIDFSKLPNDLIHFINICLYDINIQTTPIGIEFSSVSENVIKKDNRYYCYQTRNKKNYVIGGNLKFK